jgi:ferredoxin
VPELPGTDAIHIDCWRVPLDEAEDTSVRVPCLGGLSVVDLLDVVRRGWPRQVTLVDHGQCTTCHAGNGSDFPARHTLDSACAILLRMGWAVDQLPQVEAAALPVGRMHARIPHRDGAQQLDRRAFFSEIADRLAPVADESEGAPDGIRRGSIARARAPQLVPKRRRFLGIAAGLSRITGRGIPADVFPGASISELCASHNVCSAVCPTHALARYTDDSVCGIRFTPENCIECGVCESSCPENAIAIVAGTGRPFHPGGTKLTASPLVACARCGEEFAAPPAAARMENGDTDTCPACQKDLSLFHDSGLCEKASGPEHGESLLTP